MNDYIRVVVFILMPALLLGLHLCVSYVKITHCVQIKILSFPILLIIHRMVVYVYIYIYLGHAWVDLSRFGDDVGAIGGPKSVFS